MNISTHTSKTRKTQRTVTKYLKNVLGLNASSERTKKPHGWDTLVKGVPLPKVNKSNCISSNGRLIPVIYK